VNRAHRAVGRGAQHVARAGAAHERVVFRHEQAELPHLRVCACELSAGGNKQRECGKGYGQELPARVLALTSSPSSFSATTAGCPSSPETVSCTRPRTTSSTWRASCPLHTPPEKGLRVQAWTHSIDKGYRMRH
jgi:hypothetical protein